MSNPTSRKRSPKYILSPASTKTSAFDLLAFEMMDFTPGIFPCMKQSLHYMSTGLHCTKMSGRGINKASISNASFHPLFTVSVPTAYTIALGKDIEAIFYYENPFLKGFKAINTKKMEIFFLKTLQVNHKTLCTQIQWLFTTYEFHLESKYQIDIIG